MKPAFLCTIVVTALAAAAACSMVWGQQAPAGAEARLRELLHRAQDALRQAQDENAQLVIDKARLQQQLQQSRLDADAARSQAQLARAHAERLEQDARASQSAQEAQLTEANRREAAAAAQNAATEAALTSRGTELAQVQTRLQESQQGRARCERQNLDLFAYAQEVLQLYQHKGVWAALAQKEPVFDLKDVSIQNTVETYREKFKAARVKPGSAP